MRVRPHWEPFKSLVECTSLVILSRLVIIGLLKLPRTQLHSPAGAVSHTLTSMATSTLEVISTRNLLG
jgi:hypothetical protein